MISLYKEITNTNVGRQISIEDNLIQWLRPFAAIWGRADPNATVITAEGCSSLDQHARKRAGVPERHNAYRVGYASCHAKKFGDLAKTAEHTGHSIQMLKSVYQVLVTKEHAEAWFSITPESVIAFCATNGMAEPWWAKFYRAEPGTETLPIAA